MRAAVIGANGQLGSDLVLECMRRGWETVSFTHDQVMVEDLESVRRAFDQAVPDVIFNTAAFHNVPKCEQEPERSFAVNALGARNVALLGEEMGAATVFYSTDYVFDGAKLQPYVEDDLPGPLNVYGVSKLAGEHFSRSLTSQGLVLRISGLFGKVLCRAKGGNFVTTMARAARDRPEVRVVDDEVLSPTPTREIARVSVDLVEIGATGLYHVASEGQCSWYDFARVIFDTLKFNTPLLPCSAAELPSAVRRPSYSALDSTRLANLSISPPLHWRDGLVRFLQEEWTGLGT